MAAVDGNAAIPILLNLGLVTLADSLFSSTLETATSSFADFKSGFWNIGTANIVLSGVTDFTSQLFLGYMIVSKGPLIATLINNLSVCLAATFTLTILQFSSQYSSLILLAAPSFKVLGGGSHATAFLTLVHLQRQDSESTRTILYYITGGVVVTSHLIGSVIMPRLASKSNHLPYALAMVCCVVSYFIVVRYVLPSCSSQSNSSASHITESDSLLGSRETHYPSDEIRTCESTLITHRYRYSNGSCPTQNGEYLKVAIAFCLGGVPKATKPLFTTYIQHRANINPSQAHKLWLLQSCLAVIILMLGFPSVLGILQSGASIRPSQTTLYTAKIGIVLMGIGALMIGLADSASLLVPALIVDTLGVATELSLLAYLANLITGHLAGQIFMLIGSLESVGTLVGIAVLHPVYRWSMDQASLAGGSPYYVCAIVYMALIWIIWGLAPKTEDIAENVSQVHRTYL